MLLLCITSLDCARTVIVVIATSLGVSLKTYIVHICVLFLLLAFLLLVLLEMYLATIPEKTSPEKLSRLHSLDLN